MEIRDLRGCKFGELIILSLDLEKRKTNSKKIFWIARCSCGKIVSVRSDTLANRQSCGCLRKNKFSFGDVFGRLTVIMEVEKTNKRRRFLCECICGKRIITTGENLTDGSTRSCGCLKIESSKRNVLKMAGMGFKDLKGLRFGLLAVIELNHKNRAAFWSVKCECGNIIIVNSAQLTNGHTRSCGMCLKDSYVAIAIKKYCKEKYDGIVEYKILRNPKTGFYLPYDVYIPSFNVFIEVNGEQHYAGKSFWYRTDKEVKESEYRDFLKRKYAKNNGFYIEIDLRKIKTSEEAILFLENKLNKNFFKE